MPHVRRLQCPACGASLDVPDDRRRLNCDYCGTALAMEVTSGEATLHLAQQVIGAIREEGERTQSTLQRIELGQRRAQLVQELPFARAELGNVEAEFYNLNQMKRKNRPAKARLQHLNTHRQHLYQRIGAMQGELAQIDAILYPPPASSIPQPATAPAPRARSRSTLLSGQGRRFLAALVLGVAAMWIVTLFVAILEIPLRMVSTGTPLNGLLTCLNSLIAIGALAFGAWCGWYPARSKRLIGKLLKRGKSAPQAGEADIPTTPTLPRPATERISCPQCGTSHTANVTRCWNCGAELG